MSAANPSPAGEGQLSSGDPLGSASCVAYSFSYMVADATFGLWHPSGRLIRDWTNDTLGGLELGQCERVIEIHRPSLRIVTTVLTKAQYLAKRKAGYGMVLLGGYNPIGDSAYAGQPGFTGNHAVYVSPTDVQDPLADGRRPGIYKYHGVDYPQSLIDKFAAQLRIPTDTHGSFRLAGSNHFEVSYLFVGEAAPAEVWQVRIEPGNVGRYPVNLGLRTVTDLPRDTPVKKETIRHCTKPQTFKYGRETRRLVRIVNGSQPLRGDWVNVKNDRVHLEHRA